jgi:hypothetical protein
MFGSVMPIRRGAGWQTAGALALVVTGFVVGLIVAAALAAGPRGGLAGAHSVATDPTPTALGEYRQTVANLAVAVRRHDMQAVARFQLQLDNQATAKTIQSVYAERSRLLGNLAAAEARHDQRMALAFRQQIAALCPSAKVRSAPAFCQ